MRKAAAKRKQSQPVDVCGRDGQPIVIEIRKTDQDSGDHPYNAAEHPLELLHHKRVIEPYQLAAGARFRADSEKASISPNGAVELKERVQGGGVSMGLSDHRLDAIGRVNKALMACNTVSRLLIIDVCANGHSLTEVRAARCMARDYIGPRFKEALDELATHYGLI